MAEDKNHGYKIAPRFKELKGAFNRVLTKDGELLEGPKLERWMKPLLEKHYSNEKFAKRVYYRATTYLPPPPPALRSLHGTAAARDTSFIYLDVGAWLGSSEGKWGKDDKGTGDYLKRDFGLIYGPLILLCSFSSAFKQGHCTAWEKANKQIDPFSSVAELLNALSTKVSSDSLGKAIVRDMAFEPTLVPVEGWMSTPMFIVLGDMHIPVLDTAEQSDGTLFPGEKPMPHLVRIVGEPPIHRAEVYTTTTDPNRVPRLGRVDFKPLEEVITTFVGPGDNGTEFLERLAKIAPKSKKDAAVTAYPLLKKIWALSNDSDGIEEDTMHKDEARAWFAYYKDGRLGRPADIFENAGSDFAEFARRLTAYAEAAKGKNLPAAKFVQAGDMLDFWVGFGCHYAPGPNGDQPIKGVTPVGERMVRHWTFNMFGHTQQGREIAHAIEKISEKGLNPLYLFGNHDNYLGYMKGLKYPGDGAAQKTLQNREAFFDGMGIFIEHGHQWESSNSDDAGYKPYVSTKAIGTQAPLGLLITQAAFIRPGPIRKFEGMAAGAAAKLFGGLGQRMDQIVGSINRYIATGYKFYCYVMGHTHSACLTRVVVRQGDDRLERDRKKAEWNTSPTLDITVNGAPITQSLLLEPGTTVGVKWKEMPAISVAGDFGLEEDFEWIALEQPDRMPRGGFDGAVKGRAVANTKGAAGDAVFQGLPPGAYIARYYLTRRGTTAFRESTRGIIVEGLSIEGDPEHKEGLDFYYNEKQRKFNRPIIFRWALKSQGFDGTQAWFGLFRPNEPDTHVPIIDPNEPEAIQQLRRSTHKGPIRPSCRFFDATNEHPWYGARDLAAKHKPPWDAPGKMAGEWQVRAFMDFARTKKIGQVEFVVHVVKDKDEKK